jgi:transposase-like protein
MANHYSEEIKAAVMAALLTGQSVSEVAKEYKIPEGTIYSWKSRQNISEGKSGNANSISTGLAVAI